MTMQRVQLLLEPRQRQELAKLAQAQGKSIAEITRRAIDAGLEKLNEDDQQERMLAVLEVAQQLRARIHARTGKTLDIDVVEDIRQMREERDEELFNRG